MAAVPGGSRLVLRTAQGTLVLRALGPGTQAPWSVPVLAPVEALLAGTGVVEIATEDGVLELVAHLAVVDGVLSLLAGEGEDAAVRQRRDDVRWPLAMPLRAATLDASGEDLLGDGQAQGCTTSLSGGGLSAHLTAGPVPTAGSRVFVELELPGPLVVPVVIEVLESTPGQATLRGRFLDIAPIDRERIVRLVFAEQRRDLARRRRHRDGPLAVRDAAQD